jgi:arsenate reductase
MKYVFVEYPKCSTCQKAKKFLEENDIKFEDRNIITETPTVEELTEWINRSGLPINKFFNTSGLLYRSMNLKEELNNLSDEDKIKLLSSDAMLIKRPLLIGKNVILLGFKEDDWKGKIK